ncbi:MAG: phosphate ABC transporter permease PstA [Oscillatoriophycideae cyanobacterium NC_groundwater_1537_Pr4_S-0.65um_50_18]|nr:phosphate ABC transporter permease PstA [Oscillatoriophycideae cyanobacterium NC_groundwater_1537_Pr4_S-0.65um_50_18]
MTVQDPKKNLFTQPLSSSLFTANLPQRYRLDRLFVFFCLVAIALSVLALAVLMYDFLTDGLPRLNGQFITSFPSRRAASAGIAPALVGTFWMLFLVAVIAFPVGIGAGIYLEEFASDSGLSRIIEININNLAGVPSIIYGLLGLQLFVRGLEPITGGRSVLSGGLILSLLVLPIVIVTTREALRAVSDSIRQAGAALGATQWQVVREQILPIAIPGILTGTILALARAIGETAPLVVIGALTFVPYLPTNLQSPFTVLPIQIYNWISRPQPAFHDNAAAAIIVLMLVLLTMNATAIYFRNKFQKMRA